MIILELNILNFCNLIINFFDKEIDSVLNMYNSDDSNNMDPGTYGLNEMRKSLSSRSTNVESQHSHPEHQMNDVSDRNDPKSAFDRMVAYYVSGIILLIIGTVLLLARFTVPFGKRPMNRPGNVFPDVKGVRSQLLEKAISKKVQEPEECESSLSLLEQRFAGERKGVGGVGYAGHNTSGSQPSLRLIPEIELTLIDYTPVEMRDYVVLVLT